MVEKIIINPTKVRAYGNIVNVKSDGDYEPVDCTITEDTDTVNGATVNVIVMEPDLGEATTLTVTSSSSTLVLDNTVNISATLKDSSNAAISGATITFKEGTTTLGTSTTNSSGVATYTYTGASVGDHTINAGFAGDSTYASSTGNVSVTVTDHVYSISFNQSSYVATGGSVEISCTLLRDSSPFSGATISFTGGTSTVTGVTNSSGVATATVSVSATSTITATYGSASDTCTVTVSSSQTIALATNKNILSYYDSESATLTATLTGGTISNQTVTFYKGSTSLGTATTNDSGVATKTYSSTGAGDVSFTASANGNTSEAVTVEDCLFYGINTNAFTIPSNTTFSSDGAKITATTNTSGEKEVFFNHNFSSSDDFEYEVEIAAIGVSQYCGLLWNTSTYYGGHQNGQNKAYAHMNNDTEIAHTWAVGDKYKVVKQGSTTTAYINTTTIKSSSTSYSSNYKVGFFINRNRTQYYKNIKIKLL